VAASLGDGAGESGTVATVVVVDVVLAAVVVVVVTACELDSADGFGALSDPQLASTSAATMAAAARCISPT